MNSKEVYSQVGLKKYNQMKKVLIVTLAFFGFSSALFAQNASEALRYSFLEGSGSTARTMGISGAMGALGADFSVVSSNPAGLAVYRSSEFTISPTLFVNRVSSRLLDSDGVDSLVSQTKFNFNNLGLVIAKQSGRKFRTVNFAIGFNQLANYNRVFAYNGKSVGSVVDRFVELATDGNRNPIFPDDLDSFEAGLAYLTGAIYDPDENDGIPEWGSDFGGDPEVFKEQRIRTQGSLNEITFSLAGNYEEKLMIGGTVGINILNYSERKTYTEEDTGETRDGDVPFFNDLRFVEDLTTDGLGVNFKAGVIYRFSQAFRLGVAVHTPTFFTMKDAFFTELEYSFAGANGLPVITEEVSPNGSFDYRLRTPLRVQTSAAFIIKKQGFVSAEIEWLDYSTSRFNLTTNSSAEADIIYEREVNQDVEDLYKGVLNIRLGGEYALNSYRFRAGTGLRGTPYVDGGILSTTFSAGTGFRGENFYLDLAYRLALLQEGYVPYLMESVADQQNVEVNTTNHQLMLTMGFRF